MEDKIANSIALHQMTINELQEIKNHVKEHIENECQFTVKTKTIFRRWEPYIMTHKEKFDVSTRTMVLLINEAIVKEREKIDTLIDMEIDKRLKENK